MPAALTEYPARSTDADRFPADDLRPAADRFDEGRAAIQLEPQIRPRIDAQPRANHPAAHNHLVPSINSGGDADVMTPHGPTIAVALPQMVGVGPMALL